MRTLTIGAVYVNAGMVAGRVVRTGEWGWNAPPTGLDLLVDFGPAAGLADSMIVYFVLCLAG